MKSQFVNVIAANQTDALAITMHNLACVQSDTVLVCPQCGVVVTTPGLLSEQTIMDAWDCPHCHHHKMVIVSD